MICFKTASINASPQFSWVSIILHQFSSFFSPLEKMEKKLCLCLFPSLGSSQLDWVDTHLLRKGQNNKGRECSAESCDFRSWASWLWYKLTSLISLRSDTQTIYINSIQSIKLAQYFTDCCKCCREDLDAQCKMS